MASQLDPAIPQVFASWSFVSTPSFNYWNPKQWLRANGTDLGWLNVAYASATVPISKSGTEFGWSSSTAGVTIWTAELNVSPTNTLTLTLTVGQSTEVATFGGPKGTLISVSSAVFAGTGNGITLLPGNTLGQQPVSAKLNATGDLQILLPQIAIEPTTGSVVQTATWQVQTGPAKMSVRPRRGKGHVGSSVQFTVLVQDAYGHPVGGATVTYACLDNSNPQSTRSAATDKDGKVVVWIKRHKVGLVPIAIRAVGADGSQLMTTALALFEAAPEHQGYPRPHDGTPDHDSDGDGDAGSGGHDHDDDDNDDDNNDDDDDGDNDGDDDDDDEEEERRR